MSQKVLGRPQLRGKSRKIEARNVDDRDGLDGDDITSTIGEESKLHQSFPTVVSYQSTARLYMVDQAR